MTALPEDTREKLADIDHLVERLSDYDDHLPARDICAGAAALIKQQQVALAFYADPANYEIQKGIGQWVGRSRVDADAGMKARAGSSLRQPAGVSETDLAHDIAQVPALLSVCSDGNSNPTYVAVDIARAILAILNPPQTGEQWQPIETAPKDKRIRLWAMGAERHGAWCENRLVSPEPFWQYENPLGVTVQRLHPPTHWMPIGDAPACSPPA